MSDWPGILGLVADEVDEEAALLLAEAYGGRMLYIPHVFATGHALINLLGATRAEAVARTLGPDYHLVPLGPLASAQRKRREIARLHVEGKLSAPAIARRCGVHVRTVYRVTAQLRHLDADQLDMFTKTTPVSR